MFARIKCWFTKHEWIEVPYAGHKKVRYCRKCRKQQSSKYEHGIGHKAWRDH